MVKYKYIYIYIYIYIFIYIVFVVVVIFIWWSLFIPSRNLDEVFTHNHGYAYMHIWL